MKLAEALAKRAELRSRLKHVQTRAQANATEEEGVETAENANALLEEALDITRQLNVLVRAINATNIAHGIMDMVAERDMLDQQVAILRGVANAGANTRRGYREEAKITRRVNVRALNEQADATAKQRHELDVKLQALNWQVDVQE